MIGKITKGKSFYGLLRYLAKNPHARRLETTVRERTLDAAVDLAQVAAQGRTLAHPVRHLMVRLPAEERLSDERWRYVASTVLERLGYGDCPYVLILHDEPEAQHIHIATTGRTYEGLYVSDSNDHHRIQEILRGLESELVLTTPVPRTRRISQAEGPYRRVLEARRNPDAPAIAACVDFHAARSSSFDELSRRLAGEGLEVRASWSREGGLRGLSFETESGAVFKASLLDRISRRKLRLWETFPALERRATQGDGADEREEEVAPPIDLAPAAPPVATTAAGDGETAEGVNLPENPAAVEGNEPVNGGLEATVPPSVPLPAFAEAVSGQIEEASDFRDLAERCQAFGWRPTLVPSPQGLEIAWEELSTGQVYSAASVEPSLPLSRLKERYPQVFDASPPSPGEDELCPEHQRLRDGIYPALAAASSYETFATQIRRLGFSPRIFERKGKFGLVFAQYKNPKIPRYIGASRLDPNLGLPRLSRRFPHIFAAELPYDFFHTQPAHGKELYAFAVPPDEQSRLKLDPCVRGFKHEYFYVHADHLEDFRKRHPLGLPFRAEELPHDRINVNPFGLVSPKASLLHEHERFQLARLRGLAEEVLRADPPGPPSARALRHLARLDRMARLIDPETPSVLAQVLLGRASAPTRAYRPSQPKVSPWVALNGPYEDRDRLFKAGLAPVHLPGVVWVDRRHVDDILRFFPDLKENPFAPTPPPPRARYQPAGPIPAFAVPRRWPSTSYVELVSQLKGLETQILAHQQVARLHQTNPSLLARASQQVKQLRQALYLKTLAAAPAEGESRPAALRTHRLAVRLLEPPILRRHSLHRPLSVADRQAARDPESLPPALLLLARAVREPAGRWPLRSPEAALAAFRLDRSSANLLNLAGPIPEVRWPFDAADLSRYLRAERALTSRLLRLSRQAEPDLAHAATLAADLLALRRAVNGKLRRLARFREPRSPRATRGQVLRAVSRGALSSLRVAARAVAYAQALASEDPAWALTRTFATSTTPVRHLARLVAALEGTEPMGALARLYVVDGAVRAASVLTPQPLGAALATARTVYQTLKAVVVETVSPRQGRVR